MNDYQDIINYNYTGPKNHTRMPREHRAGQFASFRALSGYEDELQEVRKVVDTKIILENDKIEEINNTLIKLQNDLDKEVKITYFVKDIKKFGGFYKTITSSIKKIDNYNGIIILNNNIKIKIDNILDIEIIYC